MQLVLKHGTIGPKRFQNRSKKRPIMNLGRIFNLNRTKKLMQQLTATIKLFRSLHCNEPGIKIIEVTPESNEKAPSLSTSASSK